MKKQLLLQSMVHTCLPILVLLSSCSSNSTEREPDYQLGKNNSTTEVDGVTREYIVHVPV